jgi:hypothetical protein
MDIKNSNIVKVDYHTVSNAVRCTTLIEFLIRALISANNVVPTLFPRKTLLLNEYNETYLLNLKSQTSSKTLPDIILMAIIRDEPAGIGGSPFEGVRDVTYHNTPDSAIVEDKESEKKYEMNIQWRDVLVSFKCFSKSDNLAYRLMKTLEHNLYYMRKLFGKYGINTSFSYGMPIDNRSYNENIDKILGLSYKELIFYFKIQDIMLMPVDAYLDDITIEALDESVSIIENI